MICGLNTEIQRHKIQLRRGSSDGRHFWKHFSSFSNLRDFLFLDWARAIFLFSISEPTCDKLVLNRNKWCHIPSQMSVSAIALPLSWFTYCLFSLPLSLLRFVFDRTFIPPVCFVCLCLCSLCILLSSYVQWGCCGFHICVLRSPLLQSLGLFTVNKSHSPAQKLMDPLSNKLFQICGVRAPMCNFLVYTEN